MAKLYFRYGAMGSSKTANAIMVQYNYGERGQRALLAKPALDRRFGERVMRSRMGLSSPCALFHEIDDAMLAGYDCLIVDEAQFLTRPEVEYLVHVVDELDIPVVCYGLRADFRGELFEGSRYLLAWADTIEEVKTICWCGRKATFNTRFDAAGRVIREGEQIVLGDNDTYTALCRRHWAQGILRRPGGPDGETAGKPAGPDKGGDVP
ncbi:MAG: thymidine kinase [Clostridia bacterium]|nr:thymidine kinase [Clostridia bacterium]